VTTHVDLVCPEDDTPFHVAFVIDHSNSMGFFDRLVYARRAVRAFLDEVSGQWMFALVAFNDSVTQEVPVTENREQILEALDQLEPDGHTNISGAIIRAHQLLLDARTPGQPEVPSAILLLTDGRNNAGFESVSSAAAKAHEDGIEIVAVCVGDCDPQLPTAASDPSFFFDVPNPADLVTLFEGLASKLLRTLGLLDVVDMTGPKLELAPGVPSPPAEVQPDRLHWSFDVLPVGGVTLTHQLRALAPGRRPVSLNTKALYSTLSETGSFYLPVPAVEVFGTAVPETPLPTLEPPATPVPPTPTPVDPERPYRVFLPVVYR
jgi:hypothetical protein